MYKVYGKTGCASCDKAKVLLSTKGEQYEYLLMGKDYTLAEFMVLGNGTHKSFPLITHNGEYVGGFEQLKEYLG